MTLSIEHLTAGYKGRPMSRTQGVRIEGRSPSAAARRCAEGRPILNDVSLTIKSGEMIVLAGPNGSGKSTLLAVMAGIHRYSYPNLKVSTVAQADGVPLSSFKAAERATLVSFMPQSEWSAWDYTALDIALMGRYAACGGHYSAQDTDKAKEALALAGAEHLAAQSVTTLSGGQWQRVRLARAIAQDSPFMILDEPCTALDLGFCEEFLSILQSLARQRGTGVLFASHDIAAPSRYCGIIALLDKEGSLEAGSVKDMITPARLKRVYGANIAVAPHPAGGVLPFVKTPYYLS